MVSVPACSQVEEDHDPVLSATRLFTFAQNLIKASRKVRLTTGFVSKRITVNILELSHSCPAWEQLMFERLDAMASYPQA